MLGGGAVVHTSVTIVCVGQETGDTPPEPTLLSRHGGRCPAGWSGLGERRVPARRPLAAGDARQMDVLAAYVAAGRSVQDAAELVGIRPGTVKRHLADLRARSGLSTEQLIYTGRAGGWLVVPSLEPL